MKNKKYVIKHGSSKNYWLSSNISVDGGVWVNDLALASRFPSKFQALKDIENFCLHCDKIDIDLRSEIKLVRLKPSSIKKVKPGPKPGLLFKFIDETNPCLIINYINLDSRVLFINGNNYILCGQKYININSFDSSEKFWESVETGEIEIIWQPS